MYCSDDINCIEKNETFWDFKGSLATVDSWPMMSTPFPMLAVFASYLLYVLKLGPAHMKNRAPYRLQNVIAIYNALQVGVSIYIVYLSSLLMWKHGWVAKTCLMETEETRDKITTIMYYYYLAKVSEVLDTIFFILRKKYNQVSFLHVYHHAVMILASWGTLKYEPTYTTVFIRNINSFVHVVMYTYYGLSAYPNLAKYLWWKKYITSLQLVQFMLILIHFSQTWITSECSPSIPLILTVCCNSLIFLVLFAKFYIHTYKKTDPNKQEQIKNRKEDDKQSKEDRIETNGDVLHEKEYTKPLKDTNNVIRRRNFMSGN